MSEEMKRVRSRFLAMKLLREVGEEEAISLIKSTASSDASCDVELPPLLSDGEGAREYVNAWGGTWTN